MRSRQIAAGMVLAGLLASLPFLFGAGGAVKSPTGTAPDRYAYYPGTEELAADEIRLSEIVSAVDGPIVVGDFGQPHQDGACDHEGQCVLLAIWAEVGGFMRKHLDSYTLADIADMANGGTPWPGG